MHELWKRVESSRHLVFFEAAARLESFTLAAREMNVQQPAVSAAIKRLELALEVLLFRREHKRVTLTSAGERLFADVSRAFDQMLISANAVRQFTRNEHVTLNASSAFNYFWMMPRLGNLHERHPEIDLRLQSSDREPDIDAENIGLAVRRGGGDWPDCHAALIAPEVIYPVAAPRVIAPIVRAGDLLERKLIHLEEPIRERPTWAQWFAHFGAARPPASGLRLNDYALVLQAAMAGEGYAFGWDHVTRPLQEQGLLAAHRDWAWETGQGFYLVWSKNRPLGENALQVRDWMLDQLSTR